jgi:hypothetical protein
MWRREVSDKFAGQLKCCAPVGAGDKLALRCPALSAVQAHSPRRASGLWSRGSAVSKGSLSLSGSVPGSGRRVGWGLIPSHPRGEKGGKKGARQSSIIV